MRFRKVLECTQCKKRSKIIKMNTKFTRSVKNQYIEDIINVAELVESHGCGGLDVSDSFLEIYLPPSRMREIGRISLLDKRSVARDIANLGFYTGAITWYIEQTCSCCPKTFCSLCGGDPHPFAECDSDIHDKYKGPTGVRTMTMAWRGLDAKPSNELMQDDDYLEKRLEERLENFDPPGALYKFKLSARRLGTRRRNERR